VDEKFDIEVTYSGVEKEIKIEEDETIGRVLDRAIRRFEAQEAKQSDQTSSQ
jgi:hypothetical protein